MGSFFIPHPALCPESRVSLISSPSVQQAQDLFVERAERINQHTGAWKNMPEMRRENRGGLRADLRQAAQDFAGLRGWPDPGLMVHEFRSCWAPNREAAVLPGGDRWRLQSLWTPRPLMPMYNPRITDAAWCNGFSIALTVWPVRVDLSQHTQGHRGVKAA